MKKKLHFSVLGALPPIPGTYRWPSPGLSRLQPGELPDAEWRRARTCYRRALELSQPAEQYSYDRRAV